MKTIIVTMLITLSLNVTANEVCYYGLYNQDTNVELMVSDSSEYLESIEHEYDQPTTIEIAYCEGE